MLTELDLPLSKSTRQSLDRLDRLKSSWVGEKSLAADRLRQVEEAARIRAVAASCRLSGVRYSDAEVAGILRDPTMRVADDRFIRGYDEAMRRPLPDSTSLLSCEDLRRLHAVVMGNPGQLSPFRDQPYHPEAFNDEGQATGRVFTTLPPHMLHGKCDEMTTWVEYELRSGDRHPILVIAAFALGLQAACPFNGGNGRLARLLIGVLLSRVGCTYAPYGSVESQIEQRREKYYESYDLSQTLFWKGGANLEPWVDFVLDVLTAHARDVETTFGLEQAESKLPPLQRVILETVREHGVVDAGTLIKATGANRNTLKDNLRRLVDRGDLERTGKKRGTRYALAATGATLPPR